MRYCIKWFCTPRHDFENQEREKAYSVKKKRGAPTHVDAR